MVYVAAVGLAVSAAATWILRDRLDPGAAALPRQGDDRARVPRGPAAGDGGHGRPPGAAALPRPALRAARPDLRAGPHVHVGLLHARLDPAPGADDRPAHVDQPGARAARRCSPCRPCSPRRGGRRSSATAEERGAPGDAAGPAPVRHGHHRARPARRCGSPASPTGWCRQRREAWERWYGPVSAARWASAWWYIGGLGHLRRRLRRRDRGCRRRLVHAGRAGRLGRRRPARPRGRAAAVGVHRRDRRRDRLPARHLDGRLAPAGLAGGLRRRRATRPPTPPVPDTPAPRASSCAA